MSGEQEFRMKQLIKTRMTQNEIFAKYGVEVTKISDSVSVLSVEEISKRFTVLEQSHENV